MQWKIFLTRAGFDDLNKSLGGMTEPEWGRFLFDTVLSNARDAGEDGRCPQCKRHPSEARGGLFAEETATAAERVTGRVFIMCLCRTLYHYAGVELKDTEPVGAGAGVAPVPQDREPVVVDQITAADVCSVVLTPETGELRFGR